MLQFFVKGWIVGFVLCAPMGPIGLLCVRRALVDGRLSGMAAVLGASTVDAIYCSIAGLGITYLANFLTDEHLLLRVAGGFLLLFVGLKIFLASPSEAAPETRGHGVFPSFLSSFFIMLANPMPILVFTATLTALGVHGWKDAHLGTSALVAGVFLGSALWAPILALALGHFRPLLNTRRLRLANRIAGVTMMGFGAVLCAVALL